jgi:hypothetical protein
MSGSLENRALQLLNRDAASGGTVKFPMNCSVYGRTFVVVAALENNGKTLRMLRNEIGPQGGDSGSSAPLPPASLGKFKIYADENWRCAWCGARENQAYQIYGFWECTACSDAGRPALNCAGDHQKWFRCSCGAALHDPSFKTVEIFGIQGQREAPRPSAPPLPRPSVSSPPRLAAPSKSSPIPAYAPPRPSRASVPATRSPAPEARRLKGKA